LTLLSTSLSESIRLNARVSIAPAARGTEGSNPASSSEESGANPALLRALLRHGTDPRITLARSDPISLATLDVLTKLLPPALFSDANLLCLTVCRAVNLSLEHGNSDGSCLCYEKCAALKFGALTRRRETTNPVIGAIAVEGSRCAGRVGERYIGVRSEQICKLALRPDDPITEGIRQHQLKR
jgi:hypothetical protein